MHVSSTWDIVIAMPPYSAGSCSGMMQQRALLAPKRTLSSRTLRTSGRVPVREMRVRQKVSMPAVKRDEEGRLVDDDG